MSALRKAQLAYWAPFFVLALSAAITWGMMAQRMTNAEERLVKHEGDIVEIKRDYVTGREFKGINDRLGRIDGKLDNIEAYFRRPAP